VPACRQAGLSVSVGCKVNKTPFSCTSWKNFLQFTIFARQ
jgi:hypothetical protein